MSMKLYFYFLEDTQNTYKMSVTECEAEEKPKSYTLLEKVSGYYGTRILKSEIGTFKREYSWKWLIILAERDDKTAKDMFTNEIADRIELEKKKIEQYEQRLKAVKNFPN